MLRNPNQYGWVKKAKKDQIEKLAVKEKLAQNLKDFVILGSFHLKIRRFL